MKNILALLKLNLLLDYRNKGRIVGAFVFVLLILFLMYLLIPQIAVQSKIAMFWVFFLFSSINGLMNGFVRESGRAKLTYYTFASAFEIVIAKLITSFLYIFSMGILLFLGFYDLFKGDTINMSLFFGVITLASFSLAGIMTFTMTLSSAINGGQGLLAILSIPLFIPLLYIIHELTIIMQFGMINNGMVFLLLFALGVFTNVLCIVLFPYIWRD